MVAKTLDDDDDDEEYYAASDAAGVEHDNSYEIDDDGDGETERLITAQTREFRLAGHHA